MSSLCRAKAKDGREVVGYHYVSEMHRHYILLPAGVVFQNISGFMGQLRAISADCFLEINPATAAFDTGRTDKNGKPIFGSKGEFQGGDTVTLAQNDGYPSKERTVWWGDTQAAWMLYIEDHEANWEFLAERNDDELEIIKEAE